MVLTISSGTEALTGIAVAVTKINPKINERKRDISKIQAF
jgi:hypothetical protein